MDEKPTTCCHQPHFAKGLCRKCYQAQRRRRLGVPKRPEPTPCGHQPIIARGMCKQCYEIYYKNNKLSTDPEYYNRIAERRKIRRQDPEYKRHEQEYRKKHYGNDPQYQSKLKTTCGHTPYYGLGLCLRCYRSLIYMKRYEQTPRVIKPTTCGHQPHYSKGLCRKCYNHIRNNSPETRAKKRERYHRLMKDPAYREGHRQRLNDYQSKKYQTDPAFKRRKDEKSKQRNMKKYREDPEFRKRAIEAWDKVKRKEMCRLLYKTSVELQNDKEALVHDSEFVKDYIGFTCPRIEKQEIDERIHDGMTLIFGGETV